MADVNKTVKVTYSADVAPLERGMKKISSVTRKEMKSAINAVEDELKRSEKAAKKTAASMRKKFKKAAKSISEVGAGLSAAGVGVIAFGQKLADLTNDLADTSTKTGIAVDTLAGLRLAAEGSGLAFEQFIGPLQRLQRHMVEANEGTKLSVELFDKLGMSVTDDAGALRDADEVFREMLTNLGNMTNPLERNAILMDAFGKSGAMLAQSGVVGNMEMFVDLSREFGTKVGPQALDSAAKFQRAMADLTLVGHGAMETLITTMTGQSGVTDAIDFITDRLIDFEAFFKVTWAALSIPVKVLSGELYAVAQLLTGDMDAAMEAMKHTHDAVDEDLRVINDAFVEAEEKHQKLLIARQKIREGQASPESQTGPNSSDAAAENTKKETAAIKDLVKERRSDLDTVKQMIKLQEKFRASSMDLASDQLSAEQLIRKAHTTRLNQYKEELIAVKDRYMTERDAIVELFEDKKITEEEGMSRMAALDKELVASWDEMRSLEVSSHRRMHRELDQIREDAAEREKERQQEIADAVKESMIMSSMTVFDNITTIQESNLEMMEKYLAGALSNIEEREKAGIISSEVAQQQRLKIEESYDKRLEDQQMKIYNMKKASAIASILIDAAQSSARAFADYPFPASAGIAALSGAAALVQIKAVESTPPPTFDIGGMIGNMDTRRPDERFVRALEGEAILDRATVQSLGGESGVRNLQNGNAGGVVVIQPFKHFDRFMRSQNKRRKKSTGRGNY